MTAQTKPYRVEVYDNFDNPNERCCTTVGDFDKLDAAIACAQAVVDKSLERCRKPGISAMQWYRTYSTGGDGVYVFGKNGSGFNPYDYAKRRIETLTGERPNEWTEK